MCIVGSSEREASVTVENVSVSWTNDTTSTILNGVTFKVTKVCTLGNDDLHVLAFKRTALKAGFQGVILVTRGMGSWPQKTYLSSLLG